MILHSDEPITFSIIVDGVEEFELTRNHAGKTDTSELEKGITGTIEYKIKRYGINIKWSKEQLRRNTIT